MKKVQILGALCVVGLVALLLAVGARAAWGDGPAAPMATTLVVTNTADSGPGTLRQALEDAESGDTIAFDTDVFPPADPASITLTSQLPDMDAGDVTLDGSDAGVILDGSGIGATPETVLLDDVSLTLDGGPNQLANGDFSAGQDHWRPDDDGPGATRSIITTDAHSAPNAYEWGAVARTGTSRTIYDTTDSSDPFEDEPFDDESTAWIPAAGGSTVELRLWYRYGGMGIEGHVLFVDGDEESIGSKWLDWAADWTEVVISEVLPGDAVAVGLELEHCHSDRWTNGLEIESDGNTVRGIQIVNFPGNGIGLSDDAEDNVIGGDRGVGAGPLGQGNLSSDNGVDGIAINGDHNVVVGNLIGTDVSGQTGRGNDTEGVRIRGGAYNVIGGDTPGKRNVISGNGNNGVWIHREAHHNTVMGNYLGTDVDGAAAIPNENCGVAIAEGSHHNVVGGEGDAGTGPLGQGNLISGNQNQGVALWNTGTSSNTVQSNVVGPDVSGTVALGNGGDGVQIDGSHNRIVDNLISGNNGDGVALRSDEARHNVVSGNTIGTDASGTAALGNDGDGILVSDGASYNLIGGDEAGEGNLVSGNGETGIDFSDSETVSNTVSGNLVGTDASGTVALGNKLCGIGIYQASYNVIGGTTPGERNVVSGNMGGMPDPTCGAGIAVNNARHNRVIGNYVGTDVSGTAALGNLVHGVEFVNGASKTLIEGNVISGNGWCGVRSWGEGTAGNTVSGNYIGVDASGMAALGNAWDGVCADDASNNLIGGDDPDERNVISGNDGAGVSLRGTADNVVRGNYIGTDAAGTGALGNGRVGLSLDGGEGALIEDNVIANNDVGLWFDRNVVSATVRANLIGVDATGAPAGNEGQGLFMVGSGCHHNTIGGPTVADGNVIACNDAGVELWDSDGGTYANTISHNKIYENTHLGIDLRRGANNDIVAPVVTSSNWAGGEASGTACADCTVELFSDDGDEGRWYEGTTTADSGGDWTFDRGSAFSGANVHATATDAAGNTSEFSGPPPVISGISPTSTVTGTVSLCVTIDGDHFRENEPLTATFGSGVSVKGMSFFSETQVCAWLDVAEGAALGPRDVTVTNYDGQSGTLPDGFHVVSTPAPPPAVTAVSPAEVARGASGYVTVHGEGFINWSSVEVGGDGVTVHWAAFVDATQLNLSVSVAPTATLGTRAVTVTNPNGQSDVLADGLEVVTPAFVEVAETAGVLGSSNTHGVGWGDFDDDGWVDLLVSGGPADALYRNQADGTFTDVAEAMGIEPESHSQAVMGSGYEETTIWGDYDGDGDLDLYLGGQVLYRNDGKVFTEVTDEMGLTDLGMTGGAAWADYDLDGDLDLYVGHTSGAQALYRNDGGSFSEVAAAAGMTARVEARGVAWGDYDGDGYPDLAVANGSQPNLLYHNDGDGTFTEVSTQVGVDTSGDGGRYSVSWGDYDNDGDLDLFASNSWSMHSWLFRNDGDGTFTDVTDAAGMGQAEEATFSSAWADYDNDGDLDLFLGNCGPTDELYRNDGDGTFTAAAIATGLTNSGCSRGSAWGDYDNDGALDLYVAKPWDDHNLLWHNAGNDNHWLRVKLEGTQSNASAIGARVRVIGGGLEQVREVSGGSGYASQNSLPVEFGFGTYSGAVTVEVTWPSGAVDTRTGVSLDRRITLAESHRVYLPLVLKD